MGFGRPARAAGGHDQVTARRAAHAVVDLERNVRFRITFLYVALLAGLAVLAGRLISLQGTQAEHLRSLAVSQQLGAVVLPSHRGRIFDRLGRPLASNLETESVYAVPRAIRDPRAFARAVAPALQMDPLVIERRLEPHLYFVWLRRKVSPQTAEALRALGLEGQLGFVTEERRAYPNGSLAAHLLGFVGIDNQGLAGVELGYDDILQGRAGKAVAGRDAIGRSRPDTQRLAAAPADGADLVLTIDQVIQHLTERALQRAVDETGAVRGMALVMDPRSGEMLAMAAAPTFAPGAFDRVGPQRWANRPIGEVFEPGSTFKLVTVAAALDSGRVGRSDRFGCPPYLQVGRHRIRDVHRSCETTQSLEEILRRSSNVGAAQVAQRLGKEVFYQYIRRFGFGAATGIDLPGESGGIVNPPAEWLGPGLQTIGFGQGISATALQMLTAASALANDGVLVRPHVMRMVRDREGRLLRAAAPGEGRRVVSSATAAALMRMMVQAVEDGTGRQAALPGYVVAGKTGTAQKPGPDGGYLAGRYVASFVGFAPVPHPRLAILIVLDEPKGAYFGGTVAAPVFREIAGRALWYLRVPPSAALDLGPPPAPQPP
ncbi:MAG: penicillin-binding protein 2 [Armatimonadetes bacterium]|nr:penicillin-binding protein 2 [Armatimonadota bacterium]